MKETISKTILITFISQVSIQLLGIISGIFIARFTGPEGKGVFALYQANAQLLVTFFSLSLGSALTYFIPSKQIPDKKLLGISLIVILGGSLLSTIFVTWLYQSSFRYTLFSENYCNILYILWMFSFSVLSIINVIFLGFFQGLKLFNILNRITVINAVINLVSFGLLYLFSREGIIGKHVFNLLICLLAVTLINSLQFIFSFIRHIHISPDFRISYQHDIQPILSYVFYTHLSFFVSFFNYRLSLWILNYYLNEIAIGLFSLASNIAILFSFISQTIGNVLMPYLAGENEKSKREMFFRYSRLNSTILLIMGVFSFFAVIPLLPLLYGIDYRESIILFQIFLPGILFLGFSRMFAVYIAARNRQKYNLYATLIGFLANTLASWLFIKYFGAIGASIAGSITYMATCLAMMYYVHRYLKLPMGNYFIMSAKEIRINFMAVKKWIG